MAARNVKTKDLTEYDLGVLATLEISGQFRVRDEDAKECASLGLTPSQAIRASFAHSSEASMVFVNDELVGIWGHGTRNVLAGVGSVWVLACPAVDKHRLWYARSSVRVIRYLLTIYNRLEVLVHAEYFESIKWLEWLGFEKNPTAVMIGKSAFIFMWKERKWRS